MNPELRAIMAAVVALLSACIPATAGVLAADQPAPVLTPLVADVLSAPRLAYGSDDRRHLVYELRLANPTPAAINLTKAVVIADATQKNLIEITPSDIAKRLSIGGRRGAVAVSLV